MFFCFDDRYNNFIIFKFCISVYGNECLVQRNQIYIDRSQNPKLCKNVRHWKFHVYLVLFMAASVLMSMAWICFRCCIRARVTAEIRFGGPGSSPRDFRSWRISRSCRMIDIRCPIGMLKKMLWIDCESLKICWKFIYQFVLDLVLEIFHR